MLSFLEDLSDDGTLEKSCTTFLDLGTGNGHMLFELRAEGWTGRMVGVDYSAQSVELCRKILRQRRDTAEEEHRCAYEDVEFEEYDIIYPTSRPASMPAERDVRCDITLC